MRERDIFIEALEQENPADRAALLDKACHVDTDLRVSVERLLAEHARQESFILDSVPDGIDATIDLPISERPGTVIGPYKLLQQIGEGGMGVVFMAEQTRPLKRMVALKIVKPGMDTRQVIARFEAERQALAMMDHPSIAKVLDAGATDAGRPYFVMELVKGVPITSYCDQRHLPPRGRLELFVEVCQAVQHAHQKGIIHRDIKPTNVLVVEYDSKPVPKVIDFGVAKATAQRLTERTMFTEYGQLIGTFEYMSPEQASFNQLDVDTRSDVYSLGVLLYELLTGSTPFEGKRLHAAAFDEMVRIIREEEPPKPSTRLSTSAQMLAIAASRGTDSKTLTGVILGELDWIVMKALDKDRARRYPTANSLALDLENYLAGKPVVACPPSATYRFRKLAMRNKAALLTSGVVALSLVLTTGISIWQATLARRAEAMAQHGLEAERQALQQATAEAAKANMISTLLQKMLGWASPTAAKGSDYTVREMLDDFSTDLGDQLQQYPEAAAAMHSTIGNAYQGLQAFDKAEPHLISALELRTNLFGPDHAEVAQSLVDCSANLYGRGDVIGAEQRARQALAIHRKIELEDGGAMRILSALQFYLFLQMKYDEAEGFAQEALEIAEHRRGQYPEEASVLDNLAHAAVQQREPHKAESIARRSVSLHRRLHGRQRPETAHGLFILATSLHDQQKYDEAEECLREVLAIHCQQFDDSQTPVLAALAGLAQTLRAKGDQAGLDTLRVSLDLSRNHPEEWESWFFRGKLFANLSEWEQAEFAFAKAAVRTSDPSRSRYLYFIALVRLARSDQAGYREACAELIQHIEQSTDAESPYLTVWACAIAPDATDDPARAVAIARRIHEGDSTEPMGMSMLGAALYRAGRIDESRSLFLQAIHATPREPNDLRVVVYCQLFLAMVHQQLARPDEARLWLDQAVEILNTLELPSHRHLVDSWDTILPLRLLRKEAEESLSQSLGVNDRATSPGDPNRGQ